MSLESFLVIGAILFSIGLYGTLAKRNALTVLMSLELMFNGVNITAVAFSRYIVPANSGTSSEGILLGLFTGQVFSVFIIAVAAAEVALGVAIIITLYRNRDTIFVTDAIQMRH